MQDPYKFSSHHYQKPTPKPPRKQVGLLQPKVLTQFDNTAKSAIPKGIKRQKQGSHDTQYRKEAIAKARSSASGRKSVVDMGKVEGDSRSLYKALKRKYTTLEEESFKLAEELEKTDSEVKKLEEEKCSLLDELLVLEGLVFTPYLCGGQSEMRNLANFTL